MAQTELQRDLFRQNFGVEAEVIPNPVELSTSPVDAGTNHSVLWLSTYKPSKRPEWFTELARRLPNIRFVMVGLPGSVPPGTLRSVQLPPCPILKSMASSHMHR